MSTAPIPAQSEELAATLLQTSAIEKGALMMAPISMVHESPWNPRKYFPEAELNALAESMRTGGFQEWNALIGRPCSWAAGYEIGGGHRRRRAAEIAGLTTIPIWVRPMDDAEFLRVLTFDNSNREDPHPLDEADGFRFYIEKAKATVADIAAEIGQEIGYVYQRLKYAELIDAARKLFRDGNFKDSHAVLIARLPVSEQKRTLKMMEGRQWRVSVRELGDWIQREVHRDVSKAHFDIEDAQLVRGAPSCAICSRRAGNLPACGDLDPNTCTDPVCYRKKQDAFIQVKLDMHFGLLKISESYYMNKRPADVLLANDYDVVKPGSANCDFAKSAIFVDGPKGKIIKVCAEKCCPVHRGRSVVNARNHGLSPAEEAEEAKEQLQYEIDREVKRQIPAAIAEKASVPFGRRELSLLIVSMYSLGGDIARAGVELTEAAANEEEQAQLNKWLTSASIDRMSRVLISMAADEHSDREGLLKNFGGNVAGIRKAVSDKLNPPKAKAAPTTKAAAKAKSKPVVKKAAKPAKKKAAKK